MIHPVDKQIDQSIVGWNHETLALKDSRKLTWKECAEGGIVGNFRDVLSDESLACLEQLRVAMLKGKVQAPDAVLQVEILGHEFATSSLYSLELQHTGTETDGVDIALSDAKDRGVDEGDEELKGGDVKERIAEDEFGFLCC